LFIQNHRSEYRSKVLTATGTFLATTTMNHEILVYCSVPLLGPAAQRKAAVGVVLQTGANEEVVGATGVIHAEGGTAAVGGNQVVE
jgi:hypothetical protein